MREPSKSNAEAPAPSPTAASRARTGVLRFSAVELLVALVLLLVATPFIEEVKNGDLIESLLMTFVLVSAVLAVGARRRTLAVAVLLVVPALVGKWINHVRPDLVPRELFLAAGLLFMMFVVVNLLRFILRAPRVNAEVLCAGISGYLLLGLLWVLGYMLVALRIPDSFAFNSTPVANRSMDAFNALYFSFITLTTTGYGDFTPVSRVARMLAMMEAMTGTFYVAVIISRLVALHSSPPPAENGTGGKT